MALKDCITNALALGRVTKRQAKEISERADFIENSYRAQNKFSGTELRAKAEDAALREALADIKAIEYSTSMQIRQSENALKEQSLNKHGAGIGLFSQMVFSRGRRGDALPDIETLTTSTYAQLSRHLDEFISSVKFNIFGVIKNKERMRDVARATLGDKNISPELTGLSNSWTKAVVEGMDRLEHAGVRTGKLENWGLPQRWSPTAVRRLHKNYATAKQDFVEFLLPEIDRNRMLNLSGNPRTESDLIKLIEESFETITTGGANKRVIDPTTGTIQGGSRGSSYEAHRVLHFKSPDAWLKVNDKFGQYEIFDLMMSHLRNISRDIALAEKWGPNYDSTFQALNSQAKVSRVKGEKKALLSNNELIYHDISGRHPDMGSPQWADALSTARNFSSSIKMGGAIISAVTDIAYTAAQARLMNLSIGKIIVTFFKEITGLGNAETKALHTNLLLGIDVYVENAGKRVAEFDIGSQASRKAANFTFRATGFTRWTQAWKVAYAIEFNKAFAAKSKLTFNKLPKEDRVNFEQFGISSKDWNVLRGTVTDIRGQSYINPQKIIENPNLSTEKKNQLIANFNGMIISTRRRAVPEPDAHSRSFFTGGGARGTGAGELARSVKQFKGFPITVLFQQIDDLRFAPSLSQGFNRYKHAATVVLQTQIMGALALQLKQVAFGRDLADMSTGRFWISALLQGGALGLPADILLNPGKDLNQVLGLAGGPIGEMAAMATLLVLRPVAQKEQGNDITFKRDLINFVRKSQPGNLFYLRLGMERMIYDQLLLMHDPDARAGFRRLESMHERLNNNRFWWRPGEKLPERIPDLTTGLPFTE